MLPPTIDGRLVNRRQGTWAHQMTVIAYDGQTGSEPYFLILNSWGPAAHGQPPDDSPPGSFWIRWKDMDYMAKKGDSFAYSGMDGFPAQDVDLRIFGQPGPERVAPEAKAKAAETPKKQAS